MLDEDVVAKLKAIAGGDTDDERWAERSISWMINDTMKEKLGIHRQSEWGGE